MPTLPEPTWDHQSYRLPKLDPGAQLAAFPKTEQRSDEFKEVDSTENNGAKIEFQCENLRQGKEYRIPFALSPSTVTNKNVDNRLIIETVGGNVERASLYYKVSVREHFEESMREHLMALSISPDLRHLIEEQLNHRS